MVWSGLLQTQHEAGKEFFYFDHHGIHVHYLYIGIIPSKTLSQRRASLSASDNSALFHVKTTGRIRGFKSCRSSKRSSGMTRIITVPRTANPSLHKIAINDRASSALLLLYLHLAVRASTSVGRLVHRNRLLQHPCQSVATHI